MPDRLDALAATIAHEGCSDSSSGGARQPPARHALGDLLNERHFLSPINFIEAAVRRRSDLLPAAVCYGGVATAMVHAALFAGCFLRRSSSPDCAYRFRRRAMSRIMRFRD